MRRPERNEYAPFYEGYVSSIPEDDVTGVLEAQSAELEAMIDGLSEEKGMFAYAEGKWTIKELLGHIIDGERVFGYRLHRISHGDTTPLAGFDQDIYVNNGRSHLRTFRDLMDEFTAVRRANLCLIRSLRNEDWDLAGTASDASVTVRALTFIMAGHMRHHLRIMKERYLAE